jgi:hypothetical protein
VLQSGSIDPELGRIAQGIVDAKLLDEATIAGAAAICCHDPVKGDLFAACAGESNGH